MKSLNYLLVMLSSIGKRGKRPASFEFLTGKMMQSQGGYDRTFLLLWAMYDQSKPLQPEDSPGHSHTGMPPNSGRNGDPS